MDGLFDCMESWVVDRKGLSLKNGEYERRGSQIHIQIPLGFRLGCMHGIESEWSGPMGTS
jgi:hypothetical protein